jgi:AraC-like DNA-binding protein
VGQVERIVAELLDSGEVTLDAVAERLGIKARTLRTRLTETETSFNQVLADFLRKIVDMPGRLFIMRPRCHRAFTPLNAPEVAAYAER